MGVGGGSSEGTRRQAHVSSSHRVGAVYREQEGCVWNADVEMLHTSVSSNVTSWPSSPAAIATH